jgi:internalin A
VTFALEQTPDGVDVVVTDVWSADAEACLTHGRADGLVLNYARGYRGKDLTFLVGLPVRRLHVLARTVTDLSPVYGLADELVSLRVQSDPRATIELERLPLLQTLSATWQQVHGSIRFAQRLERLFLLSYTEADFTPLTPVSSLVSVVMKDYPAVESLDGVEDLPSLVELGVHLAKRLDDITALTRSSSPVLETLQLPACRKVADIAPVASSTSLRFFDLSEAGDLATVAPLAGLEGLERLYLVRIDQGRGWRPRADRPAAPPSRLQDAEPALVLAASEGDTGLDRAPRMMTGLRPRQRSGVSFSRFDRHYRTTRWVQLHCVPPPRPWSDCRREPIRRPPRPEH